MINKVKKIKKKYIIIFLIFVLILITPFTYSRYTSIFTKHIVISAIQSGYKVEFDPNTGNGSMATQSFAFENPQKLEKSKFTKEGYVFAYWNTAPDGTGISYENEQEVNNLTNESDKTITLYAIYAREYFSRPGDTTFDGENGVNPIINTGINLFSKENIKYDFEVSFEINERVSNEVVNNEYPTIMSAMSEKGWPWAGLVYRMFSSWNDQIVVNWSGDNSKNYNNIFHLDGKKVTLKRINGAIYMNLNDEGDVQLLDTSSMPEDFMFDDYPVTFGAGLDANHNPQRWFIGTLSNLKVIVTDSNPEIGTILYYPNGGVGKNLSQHVLPNTTYTLMKNPYTRDSYIFTGWNTKDNGTGTSYTDEQQVTNLVNSGQKIELYAQWSQYTYTVNFDNNGGTGHMDPQEIASGDTVKLNLSEFTNNDGRSFAFWNTMADGSGVSYEDGDSVYNISDNQNSITLYAMYEQFSYTHDGDLTFDGKNGTNPYIDTHIYLFSRKNANKDFVISFEINNYTNTRDYNTLISSLDESGDPYPGFVFRINDSDEITTSSQHYNFQANATKPNEINKYYSLDTTKVVIQRESGILSVKLVDKEGVEFEETIIDYKTLTKYFYYPLTVGASLGKDFKPMRHFIGTISKLNITLSESSESTGEQP